MARLKAQSADRQAAMEHEQPHRESARSQHPRTQCTSRKIGNSSPHPHPGGGNGARTAPDEITSAAIADDGSVIAASNGASVIAIRR